MCAAATSQRAESVQWLLIISWRESKFCGVRLLPSKTEDRYQVLSSWFLSVLPCTAPCPGQLIDLEHKEAAVPKILRPAAACSGWQHREAPNVTAVPTSSLAGRPEREATCPEARLARVPDSLRPCPAAPRRRGKGSVTSLSSLTHIQEVLIIPSISASIVARIQEMKDNFWDKEVMTVTAF